MDEAAPKTRARADHWSGKGDSEVSDDETERLWQPTSRFVRDANLEIRNGFVRKVYGILSAQLLLTAVATYFLVEVMKAAGVNAVDPDGTWRTATYVMLYGGMVGAIVVLCIPLCWESALREFPWNYSLVFLFTCFESLCMAWLCFSFPWTIVGESLAMTGGILVGLTLFAWCTKTDFTGCGPYLFAASLGLLSVSVVAGIMTSCGVELRVPWTCLRGAAVLGWSLYLVYDTQLIMGGRRHDLEIDEFCGAAIHLYFDVVMIFTSGLFPVSGDDND